MRIYYSIVAASAALFGAAQIALSQTATMSFDPVTGSPIMNASGLPSTIPARPQTQSTITGLTVATPPPATAVQDIRLSNPVVDYQTAKRGAERNLVIRTTDADAKTLAAIEEDLNIMARILAKAARGSDDSSKQPYEAMGVPLSVLPAPGAPRNMQIEGYGAIFQFSVNFPLKGTAEKTEAKPAKETTSSDWEQSRREIYGGADSRDSSARHAAHPEFDMKRVDRLKDSIIEALKNASNMSHVRSDETVTVVVTSGGGNGGWAAAVRKVPGSTDPVEVYDDRTGSILQTRNQDGKQVLRVIPGASGSSETVMSLRAKKSDIDAFAAGKLSTEQFRSKVNTVVY